MVFHPQKLSAQRLGELFALASILLWALFPFLAHGALNPLPPLHNAALSTLLAVIPMLGAVGLRGKWSDLAVRAAWLPTLYATLLIGVFFYGLLFYAARLTSPVNLALLSLIEVPCSYFLLCRFRSERVTLLQAAGSALMLVGALVLLYDGHLQMNVGDALVIAACVLPPLGNYFVKQARKLVSSEALLLLRSSVGGVILLAAAFTIEGPVPLPDLQGALPLIVLAGLLPFGISKLLWTECVHRLPIPKAVSFTALVPGVTVVLSLIILQQRPDRAQLLALLPMSLGVLLAVSRSPRLASPAGDV